MRNFKSLFMEAIKSLGSYKTFSISATPESRSPASLLRYRLNYTFKWKIHWKRALKPEIFSAKIEGNYNPRYPIEDFLEIRINFTEPRELGNFGPKGARDSM